MRSHSLNSQTHTRTNLRRLGAARREKLIHIMVTTSLSGVFKRWAHFTTVSVGSRLCMARLFRRWERNATKEKKTKEKIYSYVLQRNAIRRRSAIARWRKRTKVVRWVKLLSARARKQHGSQLKGRTLVRWASYVKKTKAARFDKCKRFLSRTDDVRQLLFLHAWATAAQTSGGVA